jgi:hypothetical protein
VPEWQRLREFGPGGIPPLHAGAQSRVPIAQHGATTTLIPPYPRVRNAPGNAPFPVMGVRGIVFSV